MRPCLWDSYKIRSIVLSNVISLYIFTTISLLNWTWKGTLAVKYARNNWAKHYYRFWNSQLYNCKRLHKFQLNMMSKMYVSSITIEPLDPGWVRWLFLDDPSHGRLVCHQSCRDLWIPAWLWMTNEIQETEAYRVVRMMLAHLVSDMHDFSLISTAHKTQKTTIVNFDCSNA